VGERRSMSDLTSAEQERLLRLVPSQGFKRVADEHGVTFNSLRQFAHRRDVYVGEFQDSTRVGVPSVAARADLTIGNVHALAERDGVLSSVGSPRLTRFGTVSPGSMRMVPSEWAENLIANQLELRRNSELHAAGWLTTAEAGERLGVHPRTVSKALNGKGFYGEALKDAVRVFARGEGARPRLLINPACFEAALDAKRECERVTRRWVPLKALRVECGVSHGAVRNRVQLLGGEVRVLPFRGYRTSFVSPRVAERVREYYGVGS